MNDDNASERAVALVQQALDLLRLAENAPASPVNEAFGRTGRLWKTGTIGSGGFRRMAIRDDALVGEARHPARTGWARFSVKLATGEVEIDATDGRTAD